MKYKGLKSAAALTLAVALAACGGGGGDSETATAEGVWGGTTSTGESTVLIVLPDGETWGLYSDEADGTAGILQGDFSTSGNVVTGSLLDFNLIEPGRTNVGISGSVSTRSAMNLAISGPSSSATLNLGYDASYDTPANFAAMSGNFEGVAIGPGGVDITLSLVVSGSAITASSTSAPDCAGSGSLSIRPGNKAILNFTISFQGTGCLVPTNAPISGVAQYVNSTGEIVAIGLNSGRTEGLVLYGERGN